MIYSAMNMAPLRSLATVRTLHRGFSLPLSILIFVIGLSGCAAGPSASARARVASARHVFLVRHAERVWEGEDPPLTAEGEARENIEAVAAAVQRHPDETVLVVGHVTVTGVIAALGGPPLPTICENVFSDLFLYMPAAGEDGLLRLRYGAPEDISRRCK